MSVRQSVEAKAGAENKTVMPHTLICCQMCKRVGSSDAVTVYLLGNHVFLESICSVLPDSPAQTADGGIIGPE